MPPEPRRYQGELLGNTPVAGGWRLLRLQQVELQEKLHLGQRLAVEAQSAQLEAYLYHLATDWFALLAPPGTTDFSSGEVRISGPLGPGWPQQRASAPPVVLASGAGMAAALALAAQLQPAPQLVLLDNAGLPLPFRPQPSLFMIGGLPPAVIAAAPLLENQGIPSRLVDPSGQPGCFDGTLLELFKLWLVSHPSSNLDVFTCLPAETVADLRQNPELRVHDADG